MEIDLTTRQLSILNIVFEHNIVTASKIRAFLSERISIPMLNSEIGKLVTYNVLCKIGKGRSKAYILSSEYKYTI